MAALMTVPTVTKNDRQVLTVCMNLILPLK